jgi:uncharacterized protein YajQ (UPF0234 family)
VKNLKPAEIEPASAGTVKQVFTLQIGIPTDTAREIVKVIKDAKLKKVQTSIQGDQVRVQSPSRDDLQSAIQLLRDHDFGIHLSFGNYRS